MTPSEPLRYGSKFGVYPVPTNGNRDSQQHDRREPLRSTSIEERRIGSAFVSRSAIRSSTERATVLRE
eukprot:scaffold114_cov175-Amphora_coffeaeformis.AAC.6